MRQRLRDGALLVGAVAVFLAGLAAVAVLVIAAFLAPLRVLARLIGAVS